jgi:hypothetical protein
MLLITLMNLWEVQQAFSFNKIMMAGLLMVIIMSSQFASQQLIHPTFAVQQTNNLQLQTKFQQIN